MSARLNDLSSEVLGLIVDRHSQGLLKLWQCGNHRLIQKLKQGCTSIRLRDDRVTQSNPLQVPRMIYECYNLKRLSIKCPAFNLKGFNFQHRFESLCNLSLQCLNLPHIISSLQFELYPSLQELALVQTYRTAANGTRRWMMVDTLSTSMPDYLPRLPLSLTKLKTSPLAPYNRGNGNVGSIFAVDVMLTCLPKSLLQFTFAGSTYINHELNMALVKIPDFTSHMPPNLETMRRLIRLPVQSVTQSLFEHLPPLTNLDLFLNDKNTIDNFNVMPSVKQLSLRLNFEPSARDELNIWRFISNFPQMASLTLENASGFNLNDPPKEACVDYNTWRTMLPRNLKHYWTHRGLPIVWSTVKRDSIMFPTTLQSLRINNADFHGLMAHAALGLCQLTQLTSLVIGPSFHPYFLDQDRMQYLPKSLQRASLCVAAATIDFTSFNHLKKLNLTLDGNQNGSIGFKLPQTLRKLVVSQNEHIINLGRLRDIINALPCSLEQLNIHTNYSWPSDLVSRLPRGLLSLSLVIWNGDELDWQASVEALPSTLTELTTKAERFSDDNVHRLLDMMPANLKKLTLSGRCDYTIVNGFIVGPESTMQQRETAVARFCSRRPGLEYVQM